MSARSIVIASGVNYRRLAVDNLDIYEDTSVHYWASRIEARLCANQEVVLVGGGNSAGQAAVFLAEHVAKVWVLVRRDDIASTMSRYLVDRISGLANVEVLPQTEVCGLEGADGILSAVHCRHTLTGEKMRRPARHLFLFIGADPNTGWLNGSGVALDPKGFVLTGADAGEHRRSLETSRRGVYAIGDIRAGSTKRVAAAVGEGRRWLPLCTLISRRRKPRRRMPRDGRRSGSNRDGQRTAAKLCTLSKARARHIMTLYSVHARLLPGRISLAYPSGDCP